MRRLTRREGGNPQIGGIVSAQGGGYVQSELHGRYCLGLQAIVRYRHSRVALPSRTTTFRYIYCTCGLYFL